MNIDESYSSSMFLFPLCFFLSPLQLIINPVEIGNSQDDLPANVVHIREPVLRFSMPKTNISSSEPLAKVGIVTALVVRFPDPRHLLIRSDEPLRAR